MATNVIAAETIPAHLPDRLAICMWGFYWLTYAGEGEPYADLERAVVEAGQRNFNCLRVDVAPSWCRDTRGRRRGEMLLGPWVPGAAKNNRCFSYKGNVRTDVHERVLRLFELADRHDMALGLTSWQYQETAPIVADRAIRADVLSTPCEERFLFMARAHDRLIDEVKQRGLAQRIGYVEIHKGLEPGEKVVTTGSFLMKTEILKSNIGAGCCEVDPGR